MADREPTELERRKIEAEILKIEADTSKINVEKTRWQGLVDDDDRSRSWTNASHAEHMRYHFVGTVGRDSVRDAIQELGRWCRRKPETDLTILLNSPGGSVIDGLALYDFLEELKVGRSVHGVVRGMAASMGAVLLQAGTTRTIGKNAHVLIHEISTGAIGKLSELEDEVEFARKLNDRLSEILAERSTLDAKKIRGKMKSKDWWLQSAQAIDLGFADTIG